MIATKPDLVLTQDQEKALNLMLIWLDLKLKEHPNEISFTLSGSAGTGKTTVTKELLKRYKYYSQAGVSAPTHKAKKVISQITGLEANTIQKLLGLRPNTELEGFDINRPSFDAKAEPKIRQYTFLIIDESSMLNEDLHLLIEKQARKYGTKVLYLGDKLQLPPVDENISRVFTQVSSGYELTEIVRQAHTNPLTELLATLREDILNNTWNFRDMITDVKSFNGLEGFRYYTDKSEFASSLLTEYQSPEYQIDKNHVRYCAWTNEDVGSWNHWIRQKLCGIAPKDAIIMKNDMLMAYNTSVDEFNDTIITNSEDYIVDSAQLTTSDDNFNVYLTNIIPVDDLGLVSVQIVPSESYNKFMIIWNQKLIEAKKAGGRAWVEYYKFKNKYLLMSDMRDLNKRLLVKKDIDYGYAITIHKTQGSTYNTIFINGNNIMKNDNPIDCKKLWYVALSRPRNTAHILLT